MQKKGPPARSAANCEIGTVEKGQNGMTQYQVRQQANGTRRWYVMRQTETLNFTKQKPQNAMEVEIIQVLLTNHNSKQVLC